MWENPLQLSCIGRGLSSADVMRQATASDFRLVREEAVRESPVTDHEVSAMAANDFRPVREEAVESSVDDFKVSVVSSKESVVFRGGKEAEARPVVTSGMTRIARPSEDVEFPPGRIDYRDSLCPVAGCGMWTLKLKFQFR